jgi:diguanylate cyclase (GGDEF)-like protein
MAEPNRLQLLESVLESVSIGAIVLCSQQRIVLWNKWMVRHSGWDQHQAIGSNLFELFPELRGLRVEAAVRQALDNNFASLLSPTLNKAPFPLFSNPAAQARGERMQQAINVTPVDVPGEARYCLIQLNDVSMAASREKLLREQTELLRTQTFSDGLTGVANRRYFDMAIDKELRRAKRNGAFLSLLMIDIDYFKPYNDHYGHQQGDDCLIRVSAAMASMLQRSTDVLARYGGEEFAMILPDTDAAQALQMAQAIRMRIIGQQIPHEYAGGDLKQITVSIGIATLTPEYPMESGSLIGAADHALYAAKRLGRNRAIAQPPGIE